MPNMNAKTEYTKIVKRLEAYQKQIEQLPKGSLRQKRINGRSYTYLQYREDGHIRSRYVKPNEEKQLKAAVQRRIALQKKTKTLTATKKQYESTLGIHSDYVPERGVDYEAYTLFMSAVAHDYKRMDYEDFIRKYDTTKYRGIQKRYLKGFIDYTADVRRPLARKSNLLVLDPYTWLMYSKYEDKQVLQAELKRAIPAFLNYGLLITSVQEAVHG